MQTAETKRTLAAWLAAFFLVALGAKLWTIQLWATNIPYWDQWDEARLLFKPWLEGNLSWRDFFIPHNEHRIVFTRLLDLLEVKLNGQWDIYLQTVVNALLHLAYGCGLATVIWHFIGRKHAGLICFLLLPFFALPFAAENTIHGFQSQFYFTNIFSVIAILGLGFGKPCEKFWFAGLLAAALAIFTMASGFLAAAAMVGLMVLRTLKQRGISRGEILTALGGLAVVALGLALKVSVAEHQKFQAKSIFDFAETLLANLAWPFSVQPAMAILFCLPLALVFVRHWRGEGKNPRAAEFVLTLGLWGFLQAAALAFGRANLADSSRYFDALSTLPIASVAAVFVLADNFEFRRLPPKLLLALTILWSGILLAGLCQISRTVTENYCRDSRAWGLLETENVRAFIATDDAGWLHSKMPLAVPYWNPDWLIDLLRQPKMLSILPADARPALRIVADETFFSGFSFRPTALGGEPFAGVWTDAATNRVVASRLVSRPLTARLPKLSLQIFRGPATGVTMQFIEATGRKIELQPQLSSRWQTLIVDAPASPFRIEIKSQNIDFPVAIGEIKELGRGSVLAQSLVSHAALILILGLGLCVLLAIAALQSPGISLAGGGAVWLLVLLVMLTALLGAWCWRDFGSAEYAASLHKRWAVDFADVGHPGRAEIHLREALWLRPDDADAQNALADLQARGVKELLPEKIP